MNIKCILIKYHLKCKTTFDLMHYKRKIIPTVNITLTTFITICYVTLDLTLQLDQLFNLPRAANTIKMIAPMIIKQQNPKYAHVL